MRTIIQKILKYLVKFYLRKYKPKIIVVTGTVGKTTTRKAITEVMSSKYKVKNFEENSYNTEIGLPLSILNQKVPNIKLGWFVVFAKAIFYILFSPKYDFQILEMGADKPGDISYFLNFIKPETAVITKISAVHIEEFKTLVNVFKEKSKLVRSLSENGTAILNIDDDFLPSLKKELRSEVLFYGKKEGANLRFENTKVNMKGTSCNIFYMGKKYDFTMRALGEHILYSIMPAILIGVHYEINIEDCIKTLWGFKSARGRMNLLEGIYKSNIIDDSYNSSPEAVVSALETLREIAPKRKVAVLGTMNEMGEETKEAHRKIGKEVAKIADIIVTVGDGGEIIAEEAIRNGFDKEHIYISQNSTDAGETLRGIIIDGDTILFKGSQNNVRLEKAIKRIISNPENSDELLVRQGKFWDKR